MERAFRVVIALCFCVAVATACDHGPSSEPVEQAVPSPNASILPGPLAPSQVLPVLPAPSAFEGGVHTIGSGEGASRTGSDNALAIVPEVLRSDQPLEGDSLVQRELYGLTLDGEWRYADLPAGPRAPEVNLLGVDAARRVTTPRWTVDLAELGRMRVQFASHGFLVEQGAELRARVDRYGHILVLPSGSAYRVLPPGTVRTFLDERRADASPLVRPGASAVSEGARRLGLPTRKQELSTRTGRLVLEQARMVDAGGGGLLFCRLLTELVAIDPEMAPCTADDVPLRAQFTWPNGGSIAFEVTGITHRLDLPASWVAVPPPSSTYTPNGISGSQGGIFLTLDELASFRSRPIDVGAGLGRSAVAEGLLATNGADVLRYLFLDGVPVAWAAPGFEQLIIGPLRGRYLAQWRTFLADAIDPARVIEVPARFAAGTETDGGANNGSAGASGAELPR